MTKEEKKEEPSLEEMTAMMQAPADGIHLVGFLNGQSVAVYQMPIDTLVNDASGVVKNFVREAPEFVAIFLAEVLKNRLNPAALMAPPGPQA